MNIPRDPDAILAAWLDEGPNRLPDGTRRAIEVTTRTTSQSRRRTALPWRYPIMNTYARMAVAAVAVIAVGAVGLAVISPGTTSGPKGQVTAAPSAWQSPSPSPPGAATAGRLPAPRGPEDIPNPIAAGTYSTGDYLSPLGATFEVPSGWGVCGLNKDDVAVCPLENRAFPAQWSGRWLTLAIVSNVVADPCDPAGAQLDPPVGPSVQDLVTAVSNLPGFEATAATDVTVDGFTGKQFELTAPSDVGKCQLQTWMSSSADTNSVASGEVNLVRILDVDGVRLLIAGAYLPPKTSTAELAELREVMDSVRLKP